MSSSAESLPMHIHVHKSTGHKSLNQNLSLPDPRKTMSRMPMIKQTLQVVVHAVTELIFRSKQPGMA